MRNTDPFIKEIDRPSVMVDVETLSTSACAAPIAIALAPFNYPGDMIARASSWRVDLQSAMDAGCHVEASTLQWWLQTDKGLLESLLCEREERPSERNPKPLRDVLWDLSKRMDDLERTFGEAPLVWARGADFDFGMVLRPAFDAVGLDLPWRFRDQRCMRGIPYEATAHHHPLSDARAQARAVEQWIGALRTSLDVLDEYASRPDM
jgi:hypothetical protein